MRKRTSLYTYSITTILLISCLVIPILGLQGSQGISCYGIVDYSNWTWAPLALPRAEETWMSYPSESAIEWKSLNDTYNSLFGEGNWKTIVNPAKYDGYDYFKGNLTYLENWNMPFVIDEHSGTNAYSSTNYWMENGSAGLALNTTGLDDMKSSFSMFQGIRYHEIMEGDICDKDPAIINWAFSNNVTIYVQGRSVDLRELNGDSRTSDLFNGTYSNLVVPLWASNAPRSALEGTGGLSLARGQAMGWWLSGRVDNYGISFQDWYWWEVGDIAEPYEGTQDIPEWAIHNALWVAYLSGVRVFEIESWALMHKTDGTVSPAGLILKSWFDKIRQGTVRPPTKDEVLENIKIAMVTPSEYLFPSWESMMEGQYNDLRKYHFRTPDYENGVRDLVSSYLIPIFYTDDYDDSLMGNFSLVIFTDAGEMGNRHPTILESASKTCDIVVFRPDLWIDITSVTSATVLGINFSSSSARNYVFNTTGMMVFGEGFLGSFTPDYDQPVRLYDQDNIATDNTDVVLKNEDKGVTVITKYTNGYGKQVYTVLASERVYASWDEGVGILKHDRPTLSTCMVQFYEQLYSKYEGEEDEFSFGEENWRYVVFSYEDPQTVRELNYTFSWVYPRPFPQAMLGNKSGVYLEHSYSEQSLTLTLRTSCATNVSIIVDCAGEGNPKSVGIGSWTYDSSNGILAIDYNLSDSVTFQVTW